MVESDAKITPPKARHGYGGETEDELAWEATYWSGEKMQPL